MSTHSTYCISFRIDFRTPPRTVDRRAEVQRKTSQQQRSTTSTVGSSEVRLASLPRVHLLGQRKSLKKPPRLRRQRLLQVSAPSFGHPTPLSRRDATLAHHAAPHARLATPHMPRCIEPNHNLLALMLVPLNCFVNLARLAPHEHTPTHHQRLGGCPLYLYACMRCADGCMIALTRVGIPCIRPR
jgi:hypothetical protein